MRDHLIDGGYIESAESGSGFPQQPGETGNIALDMLLAPFHALGGPEVGG